ncbi:tripartite tricarboxylate transporter permease [Halogeometricum luteum]|uniref:Tripartite tricarboxylate transporter permease n=1 Tax=Halogeometricum luteum TaxID=2950537 RepID=A0ABU2G296_9EURY|nr:tripartite tricarboxylate transporter permease [Halogeometricum sp. S3BR5-2]MDS0294903.1 tripartite tricarboxylate transporter permease [Halogeometricum sp. S3BR5-2]
MTALGYIQEALATVLTPELLGLILAVSLIGILLGATPGIGPTLALVLFFPFTFVLEPEVGLSLMAVLYGSTTFGGSVSAILVNIPGTPGSAATLLDGYPLTKQGKAAVALGTATLSSFVGAVIGLFFLALFAPVLADFSLEFGPADFFMLAVFGLSIISAVTRGSLLKSLVAVSIGVVFASVGTDPIRASPRYVFDTFYLQGGIDLVVLLVGLFAVSQAIEMTLSTDSVVRVSAAGSNVWEGVREAMRDWTGMLRGGLIGTFVGSIPGVGISAANFLSYLVAVRLSDKPESFGTGNPEGVVAAESANNGSTMGALVPAMALAIPGGASAAVFIGVMVTYGISPGPQAFEGTALPYVIYISILLGNVVFLLGGLLGGKYFARVNDLPDDILLASIISFALMGAYAVRTNITDVMVAVLIGLFAFVLDRRGYSLVAFIMGFILAPIAERGFQRALLISGGDYSVFVTRPISGFLLVLSLVMFFSPIVLRLRTERGDA